MLSRLFGSSSNSSRVNTSSSSSTPSWAIPKVAPITGYDIIYNLLIDIEGFKINKSLKNSAALENLQKVIKTQPPEAIAEFLSHLRSYRSEPTKEDKDIIIETGTLGVNKFSEEADPAHDFATTFVNELNICFPSLNARYTSFTRGIVSAHGHMGPINGHIDFNFKALIEDVFPVYNRKPPSSLLNPSSRSSMEEDMMSFFGKLAFSQPASTSSTSSSSISSTTTSTSSSSSSSSSPAKKF